ncbi:MAG: hypothetical protein K0U34_02715 [Alphaproteobacteria bacterium]|nr:hypothetical protein [Alphaproteobacteria bacterium]
MRPFHTLTQGRRNLSVASLLFATGLFAIGLANPTTWLNNRFDTAIAQATTKSFDVAHGQTIRQTPIAGSEEFWLGRVPSAPTLMVQPASWTSPVAKGDRFTISAGGSAREFEVVGVTPLSLPATLVPTSQSQDTEAVRTQLLVTCRTTDAHHTTTMKFVVDANARLPWTITDQPARTL